ncbi:hypothetical protein [Endozoicomonas sp. ISHI1]|uniref:hypothetical protein n=1 Tax=Endozoicomonas sp. ISHI1 TaxID=2825882 RepID=UPI002147E141|nr:hypothetical protein [Endozoicomonas sp. ISHI1]
MLFTEEFLQTVDENPVEAIVKACTITLDSLNSEFPNQEWEEFELENLMEGAALIDTIIESNEFFSGVMPPQIEGSFDQICQNLFNYVSATREVYYTQSNEIKLQSYKKRYQVVLKSNFAYEFSQGDIDRIQTLVNELRIKISENQNFEENHRQRLLKRLESLQSELHKRVSDLDRFWGMIGDAGVVIGKFGKDAKPIVDRIKEISEIVWKTQARTEELPSSTPSPLLEQREDA